MGYFIQQEWVVYSTSKDDEGKYRSDSFKTEADAERYLKLLKQLDKARKNAEKCRVEAAEFSGNNSIG